MSQKKQQSLAVSANISCLGSQATSWIWLLFHQSKLGDWQKIFAGINTLTKGHIVGQDYRATSWTWQWFISVGLFINPFVWGYPCCRHLLCLLKLPTKEVIFSEL